MSEVSSSYHILTDDPIDAQSLIRRAGWCGVMFPQEGAYVTFLVNSPAADEIDHNIVGHNKGILLHYAYGEDFGCTVTMFEGPEVKGQYKVLWDESAQLEEQFLQQVQGELKKQIEESLTEAEAEKLNKGILPMQQSAMRPLDLKGLVRDGLLSEAAADTLEGLRLEQQAPSPHERYQIAQLFGLSHVSWRSSASLSLEGELETIQSSGPDVTVINPEQQGAHTPTPNVFCDLPDQPVYLYAPIPTTPISQIAQEHIAHWEEHGDPHMHLYQEYLDALPFRWKFLADRVLQCEMLAKRHGDSWRQRQWQTIAAIAALSETPLKQLMAS